MDEIFDLFGDPVPENHGKRGRPAHRPTLENRNKIKLLLALGWTVERIANAIGVTKPTIQRHYSSELRVRDQMRDRLVARIGLKLFDGVNEGNVGAIKEFRRFLEENDLMLLGAPKKPTAKEPKAPKPGKKEQANIDAKTAHESSVWGELLN